jgi:sulfur-oxidizing protein SoxB
MNRFVATVMSVLVGLLVSLPAFGADLSGAALSTLNPNSNKVVTLIHIGDIHGHLVPHPNLKIDPAGTCLPPTFASPGCFGGLARLYTKIQEIRLRSANTLLINAGDTIQGSAEALYTEGQAVVNILNDFHIDAFAPGNWDYVYNLDRFRKLFVGTASTPPLAPWTALAANAYMYDGTCPPLLPPQLPAGTTLDNGPRLLPPYVVKKVGDLKVGILGFTTDRGPQVVGTSVTKGICFTKGDLEVPFFIQKLRAPKPKGGEAVDLVVMVSELGLANNIRLAEAYPGIDVILSSDMHERTPAPVVTTTGTVIVEEGDGGAMLGELKINVKSLGVKEWTWTPHIINSDVKEDPTIAAKVAEARKTFVSGPDFVQRTNPINHTLLQAPIDTVVGYTTIPLYRGNFSQEKMPGVIEGSSHDFLTDAFRIMTGADIGGIRGFRFGSHVAPMAPDGGPGPITLADLYNFIPIGPMIAKGTVSGATLQNHPMQGIEVAAAGALDPNVRNWTGGWLFNFAGLKMCIDPYGPLRQPPAPPRASDITVLPWGGDAYVPFVPLVNSCTSVPLPNGCYTFASYFYPSPTENLINRLPVVPGTIHVVTENGPEPWTGDLGVPGLDGTEVVRRYLKSLRVELECPNPEEASPACPEVTQNTLELNRISLAAPLPEPSFPSLLPVEQRNPEIQPLRGASVPPPPLLDPPPPGCPLP